MHAVPGAYVPYAVAKCVGDVCAPVAGAYVLLLTDTYIFYGKVRFVGVVWDTQSRESE